MKMLTDDKELEEIKKVIRSLLLSSKNGLAVNELCSEYHVVTSKVLPYRALGYSSAIDFIKDMPDVVKPIFHRDGSMLLFGIADQHTAHIKALVHGQKTTDVSSRLYTSQQILTNATKRTVSSFIQGKIHSIIKDYPDGIDINTFELNYIQEFGKKINPLLQGYTSLKLLLAACPEILTMKIKGDYCMIYPLKEAEIEPQKEDRTEGNSFTSRSNITNIMKKEIFEVLMKYNHNRGIFASQFLVEYKKFHNKDIDLLKLGYTSVVEFMSKLNDIVYIERASSDGDWFLYPKMYVIENDGSITRTNYQYTTTCVGKKNEQIDICLTYIINPALFWFQLTRNLPMLYALMEDLNQLYDSDDSSMYALPLDSIVVGQPCAARYSDNRWYRGIIRKNVSAEKVEVFFVDYGDSLEVDVLCLNILRVDFLHLPSQAIPGRLNISCLKCEWSKEAVNTFFELTHDKALVGNIVSVKKKISIEIINSDNCNVGNVLTKQIISVQADNPDRQSQSQLDSVVFDECDNEETLDDLPEEEVEFMLIKCLCIASDYVLHIFRFGDSPFVISAEVSGLFWDGDILKHMLRRKGIKLDCNTLVCDENEELFAALVRFNAKGISEGNVVKHLISCYKLLDLPDIFSVFPSIYTSAYELIKFEIDLWNKSSVNYWRKETSVIKVPEEQKEDSLNKLQGLKCRRKELYQKIMMNCAEETTLEEIKIIDLEIDSLRL